VGKHWEELCNKSGFTEEEISDAFSLIREQIKTFPLESYSNRLPEAKKACFDIKDAEYLALALKTGSTIWSEDQPLKQQSLAKVHNTKELLKELKLI
jgi:predicted nucleic acid-binding protein